VTLNGTTVNKDVFKDKVETSKYLGIRIFNEDLVKALKDSDNKLEVKLVDGTIISYPASTDKKEEAKPTEPKQDTPATSASYAQKDLVAKVEKNGYGDELNISLVDGFKAEDVLKNTKEVIINGKSFDKSLFSKNWKDQIVTFDDGGESLKAFKAWNFDGDNTIVFKANDGSESKAYTTGNKVVKEKPVSEKTPEKQEEKTYSLTDKLEDGEYTLGFNALYADGRQGTSMLEGFFDKNVKLVVKDGKMSITMLNTLFAHGLYDFAIQNKGKWESGVKENFGEKNSAGQYDRALFTLPVEDLDQVHLGGVIVSYMGSLESDKGNFDKYTTVKLKFKPEIKKGWNGFELVEKNNEERKKSDDLLQKKLIANGVDANNDGKVTEDELKNFTGDINIGSLEIDGKVDKGAIYNLDLLKHMGPGVKSFSSDSNNFGELPEDLFKNAVNIEHINLGGNGVTKLPENLFANNKKLKTVNLSSNNLGNIPEGLFANNSELESVEFSQSWLSTLPANVFANNKKLKTVSLSNNKIVSLPNDLFKNNTFAYKVVGGVASNSTKESQKFWVGGGNSLRGYDGGFFKGSQKLVATIENRTQLNDIVGFVVFTDIGRAWKQNGRDPSYTRDNKDFGRNIGTTAGVGLRLNTPIGPLRFDYGWPLDPEEKGGQKTGGKFYFSFGQTF